jgi:heterodisulfide reductase subunit B
VDEDASYEILREKLHYIKSSSADLIAVACASCFEQFELGQVIVKKRYREEYRFPTLYIAQIVGLALGIDPKVLGLKEHIHKPKKLLEFMERRSPEISPSAWSEASNPEPY